MNHVSPLVLYVQYTRPAVYPPLERSAILFAKRGWNVRFLGIELDGDPSKLNLIDYPGIHEKLLPMMSGWQRRWRYFAYLVWCIKEIIFQKPAMVYCSDISSYPIGWFVRRVLRIPVVLHEHDPPKLGHSIVHRILGYVRQRFAQSANLCVIPQDERARQFAEETRATHIVVAYNCPLLREITETLVEYELDKPDLVLWYHGSLSPSQFPPAILEALKSCPPKVKLRFAGYQTVGNTNFVVQFLGRANDLGIADRVEYFGAVPNRPTLLREVSRAHVGLALFSSEFRDPMVGASNKPFDYLACGLALLTNATPEWQGFFGSKGVSYPCIPEDIADMAKVITWLHDHPEQVASMRQRGRSLIEKEWNYEHQFNPVFTHLGIEDRPIFPPREVLR